MLSLVVDSATSEPIARELVMLQVMLSSCVKSNMWDMVQVDNCALREA